MAGTYLYNDIALTDDFDFAVSAAGDLVIASIDQTLRQDTLIRLYTALGDFAAKSNLGSRVSDFIGEGNTRANAALLKAEIIRALTPDGRYLPEDISVKILPTATDAITIYISIRNTVGSVNQVLVFNFSYFSGLEVQANSLG